MANKTTQQSSFPVNNESLIEVIVRLQALAISVEKIEENMDGTIKSMGIKQKITIAEMNIEANKQAYLQMQEAISKMEERIGKSIVAGMSHIEDTFTSKFETLKRETQDFSDAQKKETERIEVESKAQKGVLDKIMPYFNIISWLTTGAFGILLTMLLTGKLHVAIIP